MGAVIFSIFTLYMLSALWHHFRVFRYMEISPFDEVPVSNSDTLDPINNEFVLGLAVEFDELRRQEQGAADPTDKAQCRDSMNDVSYEVVDTILAMNGFDPHEGAFFDGEAGEEDKVIDFASYPKFKKT